MNKRQGKKQQQQRIIKPIIPPKPKAKPVKVKAVYREYHSVKGTRKKVRVIDNSVKIMLAESSGNTLKLFNELDIGIQKNLKNYIKSYVRKRYHKDTISNTSELPNIDSQFLKILIDNQKDEPQKTIKYIQQGKKRNNIRLKYNDNFSYDEASIQWRIDEVPELEGLGKMLREEQYIPYICNSLHRGTIEQAIIIYTQNRGKEDDDVRKYAYRDLLETLQTIGLPIPEEEWSKSKNRIAFGIIR